MLVCWWNDSSFGLATFRGPLFELPQGLESGVLWNCREADPEGVSPILYIWIS